MGDFVELLRFLQGAGDAVIPWSLFALALYAAYKLIPYIIDWLKARADAEKERVKAEKGLVEQEAQRNEILRNNNVVIENCTQTMRMTENYFKSHNKEVLKAIASHEEMSEERERHLQAVLNKNSETLSKVYSNTGILLDRKDG